MTLSAISYPKEVKTLNNAKLKLGFAITGSFCTFEKAIKLMEELVDIYDIIPIMSFHACTMNTRFGKASDFIKRIEAITGHHVITTLEGAEPIGPKSLIDIMLIAPCTGNTLSKLARSIYDTPVTLAVKSHLRNLRPVVVAVSTNDGLSGSAKNLGELLNYKNYYFTPLRQDDPVSKPMSLVADFSKITQTLELALQGTQIQPIFY